MASGSIGFNSGVNVRAINHYSFSYTGAGSAQDFTITTLDNTDNAIIVISGIPVGDGNAGEIPSVKIKDVSTVTIQSDGTTTISISFSIIEFYNLKNVQSGTASFATTSNDVTLTGFTNTDKMMASISFRQSASGTNDLSFLVRFELINSTTLRLFRGTTSGTATVEYKVIEFY